MKFRVLGCSGGQLPGHHLSSFLVNDSLLIDAGSITSALNLRGQRKIESVLITHVHLDHTLGLATMADNLFSYSKSAIRVWGIDEVIGELKSTFFNDTLWPDFTRITGDNQDTPILSLQSLPEETPTTIGDSTVTAVRVDHTVPSVAYFVENRKKTLLHIGDTGPTDRVWSIARGTKNLCAIVIEASFPNRLQELADRSGHLTPATLAKEINKLGRRSVPVLVTHLKPQFREEIIRQLRKIRGYKLRVLKDGDQLTF